jgi:hypothetical protein
MEQNILYYKERIFFQQLQQHQKFALRAVALEKGKANFFGSISLE